MYSRLQVTVLIVVRSNAYVGATEALIRAIELPQHLTYSRLQVKLWQEAVYVLAMHTLSELTNVNELSPI